MTIDSTLEFEKRRHVPVRYDRELMQTTVKAMKRIQEIKARREAVQFRKRLLGKKEQEKEANIKSIRQNLELLDAPLLKSKVMEHVLEHTAVKQDVEMA